MKTAEFVHRQYKSKGNRHTLRKWLSEISYATGEMTYPDYNENILNNFTICLERANRIIHKIKQDLYRNEHVAENQFELEEQWEKYRWFIHHFEAVDYVKGKEVPFIFEEPIFKPL